MTSTDRIAALADFIARNFIDDDLALDTFSSFDAMIDCMIDDMRDDFDDADAELALANDDALHDALAIIIRRHLDTA